MSEGTGATLPYRPCVGVVLINPDRLVFAGQRSDARVPAWQMPQGGIDPGEDPLEAGLRELREETGVAPEHVTVLAESAEWHAYDFPPEIAKKRWPGKFRGQRQKWLLVRLDASDSVIDLDQDEVEFSDWAWLQGGDLLDRIVAFKRSIYDAVLREFGLV